MMRLPLNIDRLKQKKFIYYFIAFLIFISLIPLSEPYEGAQVQSNNLREASDWWDLASPIIPYIFRIDTQNEWRVFYGIILFFVTLFFKKILEVNYFNAGLELTHDYKEPILHIEFTINYSDENNNNNMEIIEHIIHNTINNYSFIINTYDNYQFTITYNIKSFRQRLRQVSKTVETEISSIYIIPTININKSSSTECNFKFALHNFYKLALLNKDKEGITNEIKGVAGNFISDNIERVYTNYKQTNILKTTAKETEFKSKNELITQNTTPENNINITSICSIDDIHSNVRYSLILSGKSRMFTPTKKS